MTKILIAFLMILIVSCGQTPAKNSSAGTQSKPIANWKKLEEANYSIQYPPDWELNKSKEMQTSFILFSPQESGTDQFRENVNLIIQNLAGQNINLDKFAEISESQIKTMITNCKIIESKKIRGDDGDYYSIEYTGDQGVYHLNYQQYYWIKDDKAYVLTSTAEQSRLQAYKQTGESILNSFSIR